jgi:hypothetical protein
MGDVLGHDAFEVATTEDQRAVEVLTADGADGAFGEGVGSGSSDRCANDADTFCLEDLVEKARLRPMRGLKRDRTASVVVRGHAFIQNLRRGHYELGADARPGLTLAAAFDELALVV